MDAYEFLDQYGRAEAERVAIAAGTNLAYFEQLACGARRPSIQLADRLASASDARLNVLALLRGKETAAARKARRVAA